MTRVTELFDHSKYQVFLMRCPATLPFSLAAHSWLIVNQMGVTKWYSVSWRKAREGAEVFSGHVCRGCVGYLHWDSNAFGEGIDIFPFISGLLWRGRVVSFVEGHRGSLAARIAEFVESNFTSYPYSGRYGLTGPNSNTYPAWVLSHFPEAGLHMPWNAVGKNFRA